MKMFDEVDKNHDILLSHGELKVYLRSQVWAQKWLKENDFHWRDLFSKYDSNEDGMIDKEEFTMLYNDKLKTLLSTDRQHDDKLKTLLSTASSKEEGRIQPSPSISLEIHDPPPAAVDLDRIGLKKTPSAATPRRGSPVRREL